ncbi:hypothetical protein ABMA28_006162 [Loxostege sticticalis]|uniref:NADH dehydrogenase [ubiquinone] iron-sulfur protein 4, mitochondrial n=1 Tax=Loxostege sticticalis TaxID=481309 RepID=A0ABD0SK71_LOXSC
MLHIICRIIGFSKTCLRPSVSATCVRLSSCGSTGPKEATLIENDNILMTEEEKRLRNALETTITVPTCVDLTPVSGFPDEFLRTRRVRIYQPSKNVMQSGTNNLGHWVLEFDNRQRWENPLMGWTSTGDPLSCMKLMFTSPQEAIDHCDKNGWMWYIDVPRTEREFKAKSYALNFSWNKRTRASTK